jgi:hypothetical protein
VAVQVDYWHDEIWLPLPVTRYPLPVVRCPLTVDR